MNYEEFIRNVRTSGCSEYKEWTDYKPVHSEAYEMLFEMPVRINKKMQFIEFGTVYSVFDCV